MANADGSIVIDVDMNVDQAEKDLNKLRTKISNTERAVKENTAKKDRLLAESLRASFELDEEKAELRNMQSAPEGIFSSEDIADQKERVRGLKSEFNRIDGALERITEKLKESGIQLDTMKEEAGGLEKSLALATKEVENTDTATKKAEKSMGKFANRFKGIIASAFIFNVLSAGLRNFVQWMGKTVKSNAEASAAIAKLKGALLTLAQPLVNVLIPAFTKLVDILTKIVSIVAKIVSNLFGTTIEQSAEAAENLYNEQNAIEGIGNAAKKTSKQLASFDEINKLSEDFGAIGIDNVNNPDFDAINSGWLNNVLSKVPQWISSALTLGGIALIAIGAATGSLKTLLAGLFMLGFGKEIGEENGQLEDWAKKLGFDKVETMLETAKLLGGIALIAIGAALGNIMAVVAGLGLVASGVYDEYKENNLKNWVDKLGLTNVTDKVATALELGGIALVAIGAAFSNIGMILFGLSFIFLGQLVDDIGEKNLKDWVKTLNIEKVKGWLGTAIFLGGIVLIAIGAVFSNILMVIAGLALVVAGGFTVDTTEKALSDWVDSLGLGKISKWVAEACKLGGMALVAIGAMTVNIIMIVAGIGLLIAGFTLDESSKEETSWWDSLGLSKAESAVTKALLIAGSALIAIGAATLNLPLVIAGIALCGVGAIAGYSLSDLSGVKRTGGGGSTTPGSGGGTGGRPANIPALASGAVIPPNREFLAVLGDQKTGTNIETPLATMVQAFKQALAESGYSGGSVIENVLMLDGEVIYRNQQKVSRRHGANLAGVNV